MVEESGATLGSVSGGCLEADVREVAAEVIAGDGPRLLHYETGGGDEAPWGLGLGCEGTVDVFVSALTSQVMAGLGSRLRSLLDENEPFIMAALVSGPSDVGATAVWTRAELELDKPEELAGLSGLSARAAERLATSSSGVEPIGDSLVFFQAFVPPPQLLICGAGDDAMPLATYAAEAGFRVTLVDHRTAFLEENRFPTAHQRIRQRPEDDLANLHIADTTYAVVMTHSLATDRGWLEALLGSEAPYIGLLGPRDRADEILDELSGPERSRIYGPVGLDLGADGPPQVAVSILAEIMAIHSHRQPRSLRERSESIHAS